MRRLGMPARCRLSDGGKERERIEQSFNRLKLFTEKRLRQASARVNSSGCRSDSEGVSLRREIITEKSCVHDSDNLCLSSFQPFQGFKKRDRSSIKADFYGNFHSSFPAIPSLTMVYRSQRSRRRKLLENVFRRPPLSAVPQRISGDSPCY